MHQFSLQLIRREVSGSVIEQRSVDGYINATQLCRVAKRHWHQYEMEESTGHFLRALAAKRGVIISDLVQETISDDGVVCKWVHPMVSVNLAQWLSGEFAAQVSEWVTEWLSGKAASTNVVELPYHLKRHMDNLGKIPMTHFSILQEMTNTLIAPMEVGGYRLPDSMLSDISQGKMFCDYARKHLGIDTDLLPTYWHAWPDGSRPAVKAKLYPIEVLGEFRKFINTIWMPQRAAAYFKTRDPAALPHLDRLIRLASPMKPDGALPPWRRKVA